MKQILLFVLMTFSLNTFSQNISACESINLKTDQDYKNAEACIKILSEYALSQPMTGYDDDAHYARKVVYSWVEGTPDYTFSLNKNIMKVFEDENLTLFIVYACCLANASLTKETDFNKYALGLLINYINNPERKVSQSKTVKNLLKDWENGTVEKYLKD